MKINRKKKLDLLKEKNRRKGEIFISENNRITYIYEENNERRIIEIVNVSFEIQYKNKWITIVRYDNHHGYMHRHKMITLDTESEIVEKTGVRQKGTHKRVLSWAITDIKSNYIFYKRKIIARTRKKLRSKIDIDFY